MTSLPSITMHRSVLHYLRLALMMLAWLVALELLLRLPPVKARLATYAHPLMWYTPYVEQRLSVIRKNKDADIWFVGSSVVVWGANPAAIDPLLNQSIGVKHKSINLGLYGMFYINYLEDYLTNVFLQEAQPKVMVVGVFPYIFAYSPQILFDSPEDFNQPGVTAGTFNNRLSWWLYEHTALYRFVDTFRFMVTETPAEMPSSNADGFVAVDSIMETHDVIKPGTTTNDNLESSLSSLHHLHDSLTQRGIRLILLKFPVYPAVIDQYPGGKMNYEAYIKSLSQFATSENIPLLDLEQSLLSAYNNQLPEAYFKDYYHLNQQGANVVAPFIADFLAHNVEEVAK